MTRINPMICRAKPTEFEVVRFPDGGPTQHRVSRWVESHGGEMPLWDGNVQQLDQPAADGSTWRWRHAIIRNPDSRLESQTVLIGDYIIHRGDGDFRVVTPWDFDRFYEVNTDV